MIAKKDFLSIGETAKKLHVSIVTLRRWDASGKLTSIRTNGGFRRYNITDVEILKQGKYNAPSTPELTLDQAAQKLGVSSQTIRRWEKKGKIKLLKNQDHKIVVPLSSFKKALHFPTFPASKFSRPLLGRLAIFTSAAALIYLLLSPKTAPAFLYQKVYAPVINKIAALISPYSPNLALTLENFIQGVLKEKNPRIIYIKGGQVAGDNTLATKNLAQFILPQTPNLLADSSFEAGNLGSVNTVWTYIGDASSQNTIVSPASERTGTKSLKITNASLGANPGISQPSTQTINGRTYLLSAWVRLQNVDNPPALRLGLFGTAKTSDPNYYGMSQAQWEKYSADRFSDLPLNDKHCQNDWCQIKAYFPNVPLGKYPILQLINYQGGTIFIDDASFSEASPEGNKTGPLYPGGNNPAGSFTTTQNNMTVGDGSILIDSFGNITPNTPFYGGSLGTFNRTFDSLYLKNASITSAGDATIGHDLTVQNTLTVNGNSTLGFDSGSTLSVKASIASDLIPASADTYNLGTASYEWNDIYAKNLHLSASDFTQGNLTLSGTTGATFEGIGAGITFTGSGNHLISASAGILQIGAATYIGHLTLSDNINILPSSTTPSNDIGSAANLFRSIYAQNIYGTVTPSGFTQGSVIFAGAGGALSQNNSQFFWDNSSYSLGIGTALPASLLDVNGTAWLRGTAGSTTGGLYVNSSGNVGIGTTNPGTAKLAIMGGNVGIGTTAPTSLLDVNGSFKLNDGTYSVRSGAAGSSLYSLTLNRATVDLYPVSGRLSLGRDSSNEDLVIDTTGNVGIGTTLPTSMLSVGSASQFQVNSTGNIVKLNNLTTSFPSLQGATGSVLTNSDGGGTLTWASPSGTGTVGYWQRNGTSLAPSNIGDYVGIGTVSPAALLDVNGTAWLRGTAGSTTGGLFVNSSGNVGIGTTAPSYKLDVSGGTGIVGQFSGRVIGGDAVNSNEFTTLAQLSGGTGSLWLDGGDYLYPNSSFATNARIPSGGLSVGYNSAPPSLGAIISGNVGIGTTAPSQKLDVAGTAQMTGFKLTTSPTTGYALVSDSTGVGTWTDISGGSVGPWTLTGTNLYPDSSTYNVGIGNTTPGTYKLNVTGNTYLGGTLDVTGNTTLSSNVYFPGSGIWNSSGNVGVGTTAPMALLSLSSDNATERLTIGTDATYHMGFGYSSAASTTGYINMGGSLAGARFDIKMGSSEKLSILGSGNVGIGTTSPGAQLEIQNTATTGGIGLYLHAPNLTTGNNMSWWFGKAASTNNLFGIGYVQVADGSASNYFGIGAFGQASALNIQAGGNVGIGTTAPGYLLDVNGTAHLRGTSGGTGLIIDSSNNVGIGGNPDQRFRVFGVGGMPATSGTTQSGITRVEILNRVALDTGINPNSPYGAWLQVTNAGNLVGTYPLMLNPNGGTVGINYTSPGTSAALAINGNVGIGTVSPASLLDVNGTAWLRGTANSATSGLFVTSSGNVGIGTTGPLAKLDVNGTAWLRGTGTSGLFVNSSGNVGIGTTAPAGKLHIIGSCLTGDTLLPIRRKKKKKKMSLRGDENDDTEYEEFLCPITDVLPGDEVLSLNTATEAMEYARINKLMDMGVQDVYELVTKSGKKIRTTGNHPFLMQV